MNMEKEMSEVSITNIIRRANTKLRSEGSRICTSRGWRERENIGRWHLVDSANTVTNWWSSVEEFQDWAREYGVLFHSDTIVEN